MTDDNSNPGATRGRPGAKAFAILVGIAAAIALTSGLLSILVDPALAVPGAMLGVFVILPVGAILLLISIFFDKGPKGRTTRMVAAGMIVGSLLQCVPTEMVRLRRNAMVQEAQEYCERLAGAIEESRRDTGELPVDIRQLLEATGEPPELVASTHGYQPADDGSFKLTFTLSGVVMFPELWTYSSVDQSWEKLD